MHRIDQRDDMLWRGELGDTVAQIEYMTGPRPVAVDDAARLGGNSLRRCKQHRRIHIALQRHPVADPTTGIAQIRRPIQTHGITAARGNVFQPLTATLGKDDARHDTPVALADQALHDARHVGQRKLQIGRLGQHAAPGIEHHHRLGPGLDLRVEIVRHRRRRDIQDVVEQVRPTVQHLLGLGIGIAATTLDHVARQGKRATRETNERHRTIERAADLAHRIDDIAQMIVRIRRGQIANLPLTTQRSLKAWPLAGGKIQAQPHGIGDGQDVRKQNGRIQVVTGQRLQRHLAGHVRALAEREEIPGPGPRRTIFRQIAARLAHQPQRGVISRLAQQCAQKGIVLKRCHRLIPVFRRAF